MTIEPAKEGSKTVYARMGIWYDEDQGMIHLTIPGSGWFHTTVSNNPDSKRYHPNLFGKLKRVLVEQGRWPEAACATRRRRSASRRRTCCRRTAALSWSCRTVRRRSSSRGP